MNTYTYLNCEVDLPLMKLPVRTAIIQTNGGHKILWSPSSKLKEEDLKTLGQVTDILAPSLWHCGGVRLAQQVYPQAKTWGPPEAMTLKADINWTNTLPSPDWPYNDLVIIPVKGLKNVNECLMLDQTTKTLFVSDLVFNLTNPKGLGAWLFLSLFGTYKRFAVSRLFLKMVNDKEQFKVSIQKVFNYDFETIVMSHGEIIKTNGKNFLRSAFKERGYDV